MSADALPAAALLLRKAGVVVVRRMNGEWRCLLLRAYRNWGFPKGEIEPGEEPLAAALRETVEESSVDDLEFRWGHAYYETPPSSGHKRTRYYVAASPAARVFLPVSAELGRPEHHEFRWVSLPAAKAMLAPLLQPVIDWAEATLAAHVPGEGTFAPARRPTD
jgi:bis(5'-nucleosidyl)-tetraphosphatase